MVRWQRQSAWFVDCMAGKRHDFTSYGVGESELGVLATGTGLYSKVLGKSPEHPSGVCAAMRVAAARAERAIADLILFVCLFDVEC